MIETMVQPSLSRGALFQRLDRLAGEMLLAGDVENSKKMRQLQEKLKGNEITIAFCGHFSAGKSSMINALMGSEVLPSSPIPTSANVVKIKTGEKGARIYLKDGEPIDFMGEYDLGELKKYAVNGDEVETIELHHPSNLLNIPVSIMDTPGIDSTDDAHKVATESSMHLSDAIFYMMDYNHVQSEVNFQFTRELKERGKRVFLIVNQIDKHVDFELPFEEYSQSVIDAFHHWHIEPDGVYFTTLKAPNHPENQWPLLLEKLRETFSNGEDLVDSVSHSAGYVIEDHRKFLHGMHASLRESYEELLENSSPEEILMQYQEGLNGLQNLLAPFEKMEDDAKKGLQTILDNAPLTPAPTRELAKQFLESQQDGFKIGLLFSANKTKEEQNRRLVSFFEDISEKASVNLEWHVKELLQSIGEKYDLKDALYQEKVVSFSVLFPSELLLQCVKKGARMSGDYVLNYTKDLSEKIKSMYRRAALDLLEETLDKRKKQFSGEIEKTKKDLEQINKQKQAVDALQSLVLKEEKRTQQLESILTNGTGDEDPHFLLEGEENKVLAILEPVDVTLAISQKAKKAPIALHNLKKTSREGESLSKVIKKDYKGELIRTAQKLRDGAELVRELPGLASAASTMEQRAERLEKNRFTVALFGAFSAGKSSFANALMGDLILPVSPNPTTAAINKILPPDAENPHGSVRVRLKTLEAIENDVSTSLEVFDLTAGTVTEAINEIQKLDRADIQPNAKPHYSFLRAVSRGYKEVESNLGKDLIIDIAEFQQFVAKEEKACFVEWIELYYDCPLTQQGIVLVDTPGADSINARHTGVAFEYIKNSDAVLFVTYYNHAFSHADREFLIQLGRVKSAFELDKMFFVVNAADLAHSTDELHGVVNHVKENLESCGIVQPRIYPVSSQTALLARMAEKGTLSESAETTLRKRLHLDEISPLPETEESLRIAGLHTFEEQFISFTLEELTQISMNSSLGELKRTKDLVGELINKARQDGELREIQAEQTRQEKERVMKMVNLVDSSIEGKNLEKEIKELSYYVKQRVMLRFSEAFRYAFNPSTIKNEGNMQRVLQGCLEELIHFMSFDLAQEMRATALRIEKFMAKSGNQILQKLDEHIGREDFHVHPWEQKSFETPEFDSLLPKESIAPLKAILSQFKNTKQFFEQGGQDVMRVTMEEKFHSPVQAYVEHGEEILLSYYLPAYKELVDQSKDKTSGELKDHFTAILAALTMDMDPALLERTYEELKACLH